LLFGVYLGEKIVDERKIMMMYEGRTYDEELWFDATRWLESGMYRPRKTSPYNTVLRAEIPPITVGQLEDLRAWMATALDPTSDYYPQWNKNAPKVPEDYERIVMNKRFDPRAQVIYDYSYFAAPDKPVDVYYVYFLIGEEVFYVLLERNPFSGEFEDAFRRNELPFGSYLEYPVEYELKQRQKRMSGKEIAPERMPLLVPPGVEDGTACPQTGWWWSPIDPNPLFKLDWIDLEPSERWKPTKDNIGIRRHFEKGEIMPLKSSDEGTISLWLWSEKQEF
jgi:hypothetical protein